MILVILICLFLPLYGMDRDIEQGVAPYALAVKTRARRMSAMVVEEEVIYENVCSLVESLPLHTSSSVLFRDVLREHIHAALDSPHEEDRQRMLSFNGSQGLNEQAMRMFMHEFLLRVTSDALKTAERDIVDKQEMLSHQVSKRKATFYAVVCSTTTALLSIAATLLIHYTE